VTGTGSTGAAELWERVQEVFAEALGLATDERGAYLARVCGSDSGLRAEVESLLEASAQSDAYFGDLADRAGITLSPTLDEAAAPDAVAGADPRPDLIGQRIGQYEVLQWLGEGGMASVYLAERRGEGFTQRVALKVVTRRISDPDVERRTHEERRILARLEHHAIARLIDGGITDEGYPFYAMEYVEGRDVLTYCDEERLGVQARLRLFLDVCTAVQFAHERLVIHCDLKPNNIFVTAEGNVKLLDFGVARLVDPDSEGDQVTGLWFTPAYASPEQVRRERPGTASDVYSLGVLLYELLTGHRPYRFQSRLREEVVRTVGEVAPARPSEIVTQPTQRTHGAEVPADALARSRDSSPEAMRRLLKGDLDAIVMKALAKEQGARYSTAEQLAGDIRRHLEHRPISSLPRTRRYRLSKFVRRNRGTVVAAAVVFITLGAGIAATMWQAGRATEAATLARQEAEKAALVASLMTEMFRLSDPNEALGDTITARGLLDRGAERVRSEFGDQPIVQADLLTEVAGVYRNLGLYRRAEPLARQALALRERSFGPATVETSESLVQLGTILGDLGRQGEAIETLDRAIRIREPLVAFPDTVLIRAQATLAWMVRTAQESEWAAELFTAALEGERAIDPDGPGVADMTFGLAATYHDAGLLDRADSLLRSALGEIETATKPTPMAVGALRNVGMIRRVREQYRESAPILRAAVEMAERLYGPEHREVFEANAEYGLALMGTGEWDEAESVLRGALRSSIERLGPTHTTTAGLQEALAALLVDRGDFDEAVVLHQMSLQEKIVRHEGQDHSGVVASLAWVAEALVGAGRFSEARQHVTRAQEMNARLGAVPSVYDISLERSLGNMAMTEGEAASARAHFERAVALAEELLSRPDHRYAIWAKRDYALFLAEVGETERAGELLRWVLAAQIENLGEPHPRIDRTRARLASLTAR
jgi:serine/threonine protein kinase/tetratricopeptide (TPR) repeat protein